VKAKFTVLKKKMEGLKNKIRDHPHHQLILGIFTVLCLFMVMIPLYNVYSAEEPSPTPIVTSVVLGNESYGTVAKIGPYGNVSSPVKVAYILGEHPREHVAHKALGENIKENSQSLKYCYYLYYINVTKYASDFSKGRMNGQVLSNKYVVPDIAQESFSLAIDVHGTDGEYSKRVFLFTPLPKGTSLDIAHNLTNLVEGVPYYSTPNPSSTAYTTIPLIKKGVPAIVYESFTAQPYNLVKEQNKKFILGVDELNLEANPCY
jgi:hypothetical protein